MEMTFKEIAIKLEIHYETLKRYLSRYEFCQYVIWKKHWREDNKLIICKESMTELCKFLLKKDKEDIAKRILTFK